MQRQHFQLIVSIVAKEHDSYFEFLMDDSFKTDHKKLLEEEQIIREWLGELSKRGYCVDSIYKYEDIVKRIKEKFGC